MADYEDLDFAESLEASEFQASGVSVEAEIEAARARLRGGRAGFLQAVESMAIPSGGEEALETGEGYLEQFEAFVARLRIRHFAAHEFLAMGGSNTSGPCAGKNHLPPSNMWTTFAATALFADAIRARLGSALIILSGYRSDSYNACIGGASQSQHKRFCALDITPASASIHDLWSAARALRAETPQFAGGIGKYNSFVHIDTRGANVDWVG